MTLMRPSFKGISYLVGNEETLLDIMSIPVLPVFSEQVVSFLSDLSASILRDRNIVRSYRDIAGYAYWIRKASILPYKDTISRADQKIGRGVTFHIAPSNIPIQFALSMVHALLAGNACVIRVSMREFPQVDILCEKLRTLLTGKHTDLARYICIIRYDHDDEITAWLSSFCDVRIIWGGDRTVRSIRTFPIPPRSTELVFADRYSLAVINSEELLKADISDVVDKFWSDTYFVDQNACSSPRLIAWTGTEREHARSRFWDALHKKVEEEYDVADILSVNKLTSFTRLAMQSEEEVNLVSCDGYIYRVWVKNPTPELMRFKDGGGYFFECSCDSLDDLMPLLNNKACQTVALFGIETSELKNLVFEKGLKGVDRIVALGDTTAPGLDWDGYSLVDTLSRYVEVGK